MDNLKSKIKEQLGYSLSDSPNEEILKIFSDKVDKHYRGKVRDNFYLEDKIVMVTSDRVSAFDHVLGTIPFKGEILTDIANFWFDKTVDIIDNHIISRPDPQVLVVKKASPLPVEVIVRGYITGSLWRDYCNGKGNQYGFELPHNLKKDQKFDHIIITPTTKEDYGLHDQPISREEIINQGLVSKDIYESAEDVAIKLFNRGQEWADKMGLILVDTKYEFGMVNNKLIVIDEIHTPDSSRYWVKEGYEDRFNNGDSQKMLDKENIREWLLEKGFSGEGAPPELSDNIRIYLAEQYMNLYKKLTNRKFEPSMGEVKNRICKNLESANIK
ncbi:MAG: phosphoribosylaminoimidazolesuccinocarboxamide synthase [Pelagibacteraceae bacterium TMED237]|nr:phosphoribosylaminoimidazolesuccinocarboxamide synthase [Candidatus Neomarinimicrobiota bacterium]OUW96623.1 MAG: phosphoribosylaminoimidazolesuccinocarboxamide synthase [Pelagibacteraceae bacterium TMED237]|tara:strand:- start:1441 stop:2424 length:984 start_codon:yes stop_codon:yes gene_type:complete